MAGGEDEGCEAAEINATNDSISKGQNAYSRASSPPIDKDAFITKLIEKKKNRNLKGHVGLTAKAGMESSGDGKKKLTALDEIRKFRHQLRSYTSKNGTRDNNGPMNES